MKNIKTFLLIAITMFIFGCYKQEPEQKCGKIIRLEKPYFDVRNKKTFNVKRFADYTTNFNKLQVGDEYCFLAEW
jgi:hypothetical protein